MSKTVKCPDCKGRGLIYAHCKRECGMSGHDMHADTCSIDVCHHVKPTETCVKCKGSGRKQESAD